MFSRLLCLLVLVFQSHPGFTATDAMDEVNRSRAKRGLAPFARDEQLSQAAAACADYRANRLMRGHASSEYDFLPDGAWADAAGCAAWPAELGWGGCCTYENWNYAGAAYEWGRDGQRYMQLFVSHASNEPPAPTYFWKRIEAGWWYIEENKYVGFLHNNRDFQWRREDGSFSEWQRLEPGEFPKK